MRRRLIKTIITVIISLYLLSIMVGALEQSHNISGGIPPADDTKKYTGVCYGPFRDNEAPGYYPTLEELQEDINFISKLANSTRTYSVAGTLSEVPDFCQDAGIDCYPGAWISKQKGNNEREIQRLIHVANQNLSCIKGLIVGNEVLLRDDVTEDELIEYITQVKNNTNIPVSTAEIWGTWLDHPQLAENVDYIIIHIHPYWEGGTYYGESRVGREGIPASNASEQVIEKWKEVKAKYPDKDVIIGETGWPTQGETIGDAIPSEENQMLFLSDFLTAAEENNTRYFYFEVFDEPCKECSDEANVAEGHWGLYYSNGSLKPLLKNLVPEEAREGFYRPPRDRKVTLPWFVYKDALSPENHFIPSGWMGDLVDWPGDPQEIFDDACTDDPYVGDTCVRITYVPGSEGWGGIYWQFPENNWGKCLGYDISDATKLTFWAKGAKGGEKAEFKTGGINRHAYNVYTDKNATNNHYFPSGWYNGASNILFNDNWMDNPHSGTSCIKVTWNGAAGKDGWKWNGVMWQNPEGNWVGDSGYGYNLTDATKLTFWARTDEPGLKVKFLIGYPDDTSGEVSDGWRELYPNWTEYEINLSGIDLSDIAGGFAFLFNDVNDPNPDGCIFYLDDIKYDKVALNDTDKPYQDSYGPVSSELVTLTNNWTQYAITLADDNLTHVIGGFCWVAAQDQNPEGCTIYIDEISFVESPPIPKIIGIDPPEPVASPNEQWITILGTGFAPDSTVIFRIGSDTYSIPSNHTDYRNSTEIRVNASLTDPGTWTVQITNPEDRQSNIFNFTVVPPDDTTPPESISDLNEIDKGSTWILWNWTNPPDPDFNDTEVWLDGEFKENITIPEHSYNATGLSPNTNYEIGTRTVDDSGNVNQTWVNDTATTLFAPDLTPPIISNVTATNITTSSATITWDTDEPSDSEVKYGTESGNYTLLAYNASNVTPHALNLTGLGPDTIYYFVVNSTDPSGNSAETSEEYNFTTLAAPVVTTIEVAPSTATLKVGDTKKFAATAYDQYSEEMSGVTFTWESSDTGVGTIDTDGLFTAVGAGTATVTATADSVTGTADVSVAEAPTPTPAPIIRRGGGGTPRDTDGDGYTDIQELLAGTNERDPCDPNLESAACLAISPPTAAPTPAATPAAPTPTVVTVPPPAATPAAPTPEEPGFEAIFSIGCLLVVAYLVLRKR